MLKRWFKGIIVAASLMMLCMPGLCLAEEAEANWVNFYTNWPNEFYVNADDIKLREISGRKYLDLTIKRKENRDEDYVIIARSVRQTTGEWHELLDIGRGRGVSLKWFNKYSNPKEGTADAENVVNGGWNMTMIDGRCLEWVIDNRPELVEEIMQSNHYNTFSYNLDDVRYMITKNDSGNGGKYTLTSEDGMTGITFDYKPESNLFLLYNRNESEPYSSQKYASWSKMTRNSPDNYDDFNGSYERNYQDEFNRFVDGNKNNKRHIFKWETQGMLTFLRLKGHLYLQ